MCWWTIIVFIFPRASPQYCAVSVSYIHTLGDHAIIQLTNSLALHCTTNTQTNSTFMAGEKHKNLFGLCSNSTILRRELLYLFCCKSWWHNVSPEVVSSKRSDPL